MPLIKTTSNLNIEKPEAAHNAWEQAYWRLATLLDLWATQIAAGNTVVSGGTLTLNGTNGVDLEATVVAFAGQATTHALTAQTPIATLATGNTYVVYVDAAGALQVLVLDAAGLWSGALPAQFVLLGLAFEVEGAWVLHNRPLGLGRGQANGYAALDGAGAVVQEPASKGLANGVSSLDGAGAVVQEPASKGQANGLAALDGAGAVPLAQIPMIPYTKLSGGDGSYTEAVAAATFTADFLINRRFMVDQIYGSLNAGFVAIAQGINSAFPAGEQLVTGWTTPRMKLYNENAVQTVGISWRYLT